LLNGQWRSVAVQAISEPEICHGPGFNLRADARVRVHGIAGSALAPLYCKNRDEQLTFIVRVMVSSVYIL